VIAALGEPAEIESLEPTCAVACTAANTLWHLARVGPDGAMLSLLVELGLLEVGQTISPFLESSSGFGSKFASESSSDSHQTKPHKAQTKNGVPSSSTKNHVPSSHQTGKNTR
jgi:hypothetical protein